MKRPILAITIGLILGIIGGLYLNNIALFILPYCLLFIIRVVHINKISRIIKIILPYSLIVSIFISSMIGYIYVKRLENIYEKLYNHSNQDFMGTVISNKIEKQYCNRYKIKIENSQYKNYCIFLDVSKKEDIYIHFGDQITFKGEFTKPSIARNEHGFNYQEYLKTIKVFGTVKLDGDIKILKMNHAPIISIFANKVKSKIIDHSREILPKTSCEIFLGILLGYTDEIDSGTKDNFSNSSLSHLLAVSGMHISYIIWGLTYVLDKLNIHRSIHKIVISLFLIFFLYLTGFTSSVIRASIMGILFLMQSVVKRKNDISTSISLSALSMLLENPYRIKNIGFALSYLATIGIIIFTSKRNTHMKELIKSNRCRKILASLKSMIFISIHAQVMTFPITLYYFSTISGTFLISNLIAGNIIGVIAIGGFLLIIISFINLKLASIYSKFYHLFLQILLKSTQIISKIPISKIYSIVPNVIFIIIYYIVIAILIYYNRTKRKEDKRYLENKLIQKVNQILDDLKRNIKVVLVILIIFMIVIFILKLIPKNLKIYFIDVGQGDSSLIVTPFGKKIMIDSGGNEDTEGFDIGKQVLLPYLLNRNIRSLDYIMISHMDSDHCKAFEYILENIKVKNIIISKQVHNTQNLNHIIQIAKKKKMRVMIVQAGDHIRFDKFTNLKILYPDKNLQFDDLNNNSILARLEYQEFSMLFTGDIGKEAEEYIIHKFPSNLKSKVLKIAHHGSKTSTTQEFLEKVNPQIALIGVGENNKFGHPSQEVIQRLIKMNCKIDRTDKMGEITIEVNRKGKYKIKEKIRTSGVK